MQAQICDNSHFDPEAADNSGIVAQPTGSFRHPVRGTTESEDPAEKPRDADQIADALKNSLDVLTGGASIERFVRMRNLIEQHRAMAENLAGTETVEQPSDAQLISYARNYLANPAARKTSGQAIESGISEKVDVSRVLIERIEGLPSKAQVSSLEAANAVLEGWAARAADVCHDRCDFEIVFEDGLRYRGRVHLQNAQKRVSLSRHVRKQLAALTTIANTRKRSRAVDEPVIRLIGANLAEAARIALDHYNI